MTTRGGVVVIAVVALVWLMNFAEGILVPLIGALLLTALCEPMVRWAKHRLKVPRFVTALALMIGLFLLITGPVATMLTSAMTWLNPSPQTIEHIKSELGVLQKPIDQVTEVLHTFRSTLGIGSNANAVEVTSSGEGTSFMGMVASQVGGVLGGLLMTQLLSLFMLVVGGAPMKALLELTSSRQQREAARDAVDEIKKDVSRYLVALTAINFCEGVATGVVMYLLGMPHPLLLGVVAGTFNFVPYLGGIATFLVVAVASLLASNSLIWAAVPAACYIAINMTEAYIVSPLVYSERLSIHPLMILLALLFFGWIWSIPGTLMAVPLLVCITVICSHIETLRPIAAVLAGSEHRADNGEASHKSEQNQ